MSQRRPVFLLCSTFLLSPTLHTQQVTLQPWTEVYGTVNGQQLGKYVTGITASTNFSYKAAVSKVGNTGVYLLQSQNDTVVRRTFIGENLLTGDLNNDGYTDIVTTKSVNGWDTVFVYWGNATGIDTLSPLAIPGENRNDFFGARLIGDVNNDGVVDLVITASGYPDPLGMRPIQIHSTQMQPSGMNSANSLT